MDSVENGFLLALHHTSRAWRHALDRRLKHLGLSHAGWLAVGAVVTADIPLSQCDLSQRLGVGGPTMVQMIDRLVAAGLVKRKCSDTDRRINFIIATDAGTQLYAQVKIEEESMRGELLAKMNQGELLIATELLELALSKAVSLGERS